MQSLGKIMTPEPLRAAKALEPKQQAVVFSLTASPSFSYNL
jgi:hypothetical protein